MQNQVLEFADRLNEIMPVIMKEFTRRQASELYKGKITVAQCLILEFLQKEGETKMSSLANFMSVSTAAITGIVDRLVRERFVVRLNEPQDRRIIKVRLTPKGLDLVKKSNHQRQQMVVSIFGKISQKEREDYLKILTRIRDILLKEKQ